MISAMKLAVLVVVLGSACGSSSSPPEVQPPVGSARAPEPPKPPAPDAAELPPADATNTVDAGDKAEPRRVPHDGVCADGAGMQECATGFKCCPPGGIGGAWRCRTKVECASDSRRP